MNAIDRDDAEKKIAEIRKSAEEARKTDRSWVDGQDYADDVEFLLDELGRVNREQNKLIEGLRWYADEQNYDGSEFRLSETEKDEGQRARDILHEIGVTVE